MSVAGKDGSLNLTVAGIGDVELLSLFGYYAAYTDFDSARELAGYEIGEATDVIIFGQSRGETAAIYNEAVKELAGFSITVWEDMGQFVLNGISLYNAMFVVLILVMMLIVSILIINLVFMMGMERRQEIGTLKALGFSRGRIVSLFLAEIMTIATVFCALGLAAGSGLVLALTNVGIKVGPPLDFALGSEFFIRYDFSLVWSVAGVILLFTIAAALWPSWRSASLDPADTMVE